MIFVTVGTHEQQFNRLVECVDQMKEKGLLQEEVIVQTGYSTYEPKHCTWQKLFPFQQMLKNAESSNRSSTRNMSTTTRWISAERSPGVREISFWQRKWTLWNRQSCAMTKSRQA